MKKFLLLGLSLIMCVSLAACSKKVEEQNASFDQLNAVITAAQNYLNSDEFQGHVSLFEATFGQEAKQPEITVAFTFEHDDVMGFAYNLILFNIKADTALDENGEVSGFDTIQVIIDTKDNKAYDSLTYNEARNNFDGEISTYEDGIIGFLNSGVLTSGNNDWLWSENEISTRFTKDNIKTINESLK